MNKGYFIGFESDPHVWGQKQCVLNDKFIDWAEGFTSLKKAQKAIKTRCSWRPGEKPPVVYKLVKVD